jgi:hypothetical protein
VLLENLRNHIKVHHNLGAMVSGLR